MQESEEVQLILLQGASIVNPEPLNPKPLIGWFRNHGCGAQQLMGFEGVAVWGFRV